MISFIVPAHNEQRHLARTLQAIHVAAKAVGQPYEIIVVDDASADATAEIARHNNARVVSVNHRQIAATRNSGARSTNGERLLFVDADTVINPRVVAAAVRSMDKGAAGGGAPARFDASAPLYAQLLMGGASLLMRLPGITGGAFLFCTREAFQATGGFDERLFGAEDAAMSWALKRQGRFVVLWHHVATSGRRMRGMRGLRMLATLFFAAFFRGLITRRAPVKKIWYDSNREQDDTRSDPVVIRMFNAVMLPIVMVWIVPWEFIIPSSLAPRNSLLGGLILGRVIFNCHIALALWPGAGLLCRHFFQQTRWLERVRLIALIALCVWAACGATRVVLWFWPSVYHWVAHFYHY